MRELLFLSALGLFAVGCTGVDLEQDTDEDTLTDVFEMVIGTDPEKKDTDGDGKNDGVEYTNYFDPLDETDFNYTGEYPRGPLPEDGIAGEGWDPGQVSNDWTGVEQFDEEISLHKFYGNVVLVELAADW